MAIHPHAQSVVDKILYEIQMATLTATILSKGGQDGVIANALLESFLIHVRCLYEFFSISPDPKFKDKNGDTTDVTAEDFFAEAKRWRNVRERLFKYTRDEFSKKGIDLTKFHEHLAHLSYARTREKIGWDIGRIGQDVEQAWNLFLDTLDANERAWFPPKTTTGQVATAAQLAGGAQHTASVQSFFTK